jgi:hypothetical protein
MNDSHDTPDTPSPTALALLDGFATVPRLCDRSNGWKPEVQRAFIAALAETGSVKAACRRVGRSDNGAYQLRRHPDAGEFRAAWDAAAALGVRRIEDAAMDRALYGVEETVQQRDGRVVTRTRHNERLVMFLLRNRLPNRFAAGGGARGLNAVGQMEVKRLRREWEAEQAKNHVSPAEVRASIERKVEALRQQVIAGASPAALEHEIAHIAQRRADAEAGWRPGEDYAQFAEKAAELLPKYIAEVRAEFFPAPLLECKAGSGSA